MQEKQAHSTLDVLLKVDDLLRTKAAWIKQSLARNRYGDEVPPNDSRAVCWCLEGAIAHVLDWPDYPPQTNGAVRLLTHVVQGEYDYYRDIPLPSVLWLFNDDFEYDAVKAVLGQAIKAAKEQNDVA